VYIPFDIPYGQGLFRLGRYENFSSNMGAKPRPFLNDGGLPKYIQILFIFKQLVTYLWKKPQLWPTFYFTKLKDLRPKKF
jgi:hypothetical protein